MYYCIIINILPFLHFKFFVNPANKRAGDTSVQGKHILKANRKNISTGRCFELHSFYSVQIFCMPSAVRIVHALKMYEKVFAIFGVSVICSLRFPLSVNKPYEVLITFSNEDMQKLRKSERDE